LRELPGHVARSLTIGHPNDGVVHGLKCHDSVKSNEQVRSDFSHPLDSSTYRGSDCMPSLVMELSIDCLGLDLMGTSC
jgi:hypothetical protein